jgi:hypothetical protein
MKNQNETQTHTPHTHAQKIGSRRKSIVLFHENVTIIFL